MKFTDRTEITVDSVWYLLKPIRTLEPYDLTKSEAASTLYKIKAKSINFYKIIDVKKQKYKKKLKNPNSAPNHPSLQTTTHYILFYLTQILIESTETTETQT